MELNALQKAICPGQQQSYGLVIIFLSTSISAISNNIKEMENHAR